MARGRGHGPGEKPGCCQLVALVFALLVASQVLVLLLRLLHEVVILSATLIRWIGIGLAGAAGIAALIALVLGAGYGFRWLGNRLFGWTRRFRQSRQPARSYAREARKWHRGIVTTVRRLRRRGWLSRDDANRYRAVAVASVRRLRALDKDLATLRSVPASERWQGEVAQAAQTVVDHLQRTHRGLVRLLAESAVQRGPAVEMNLQDAADDLESLLAALEDLETGSPVSEAAAELDEDSRASDRTRTSRQRTEDVESRDEGGDSQLHEPPVTELQ